MSDAKVLPTREGYDQWADSYDADAVANWLIALDEAAVQQRISDVVGIDLLDVGGGTGRHAIRLARAGARVTVIDFSEEMMAKARAKPGADEVHFLTHDVLTPFPFAEGSFDCVLCALVLEHIPVPALPEFFRELGRMARGNAQILVTAMHPARFLRGRSANFRDEAGTEIRPLSHVGTLSDYVMAAVSAGLKIDALAEQPVDEELVRRFPRAAQSLGWPALFVMTLKRAPR
jgi:2-polyprenyl-3-methyl-5-hydroxy-6-metoxy-1,4-benzoquinol methylase